MIGELSIDDFIQKSLITKIYSSPIFRLIRWLKLLALSFLLAVIVLYSLMFTSKVRVCII